jgi:WD40 repeat protein
MQNIWLAEQHQFIIFDSILKRKLFQISFKDSLLDCVIADKAGLLVALTITGVEVIDLTSKVPTRYLPALSARGLCLDQEQTFCVYFGEKMKTAGFLAVIKLSDGADAIHVQCSSPVKTVLVSACRSKLLALCDDGYLRTFDIFTMKQTSKLFIDSGAKRIDSINDGQFFAVSRDSSISILDQYCQVIHHDGTSAHAITTLAADRAGKTLAVARENGTIQIFDIESWRLKIMLVVEKVQNKFEPSGRGISLFQGIAALTWNNNGGLAASASDMSIYFWDKEFTLIGRIGKFRVGQMIAADSDEFVLCRSNESVLLLNTEKHTLSEKHDSASSIIKCGWTATTPDTVL